MREQPSIVFEIPVPWASKPARISAKGLGAILVAAMAALGFILILNYF